MFFQALLLATLALPSISAYPHIKHTPSPVTSTSLNNVYIARQNTRKKIMKKARRAAMLPKGVHARAAQASATSYPICNGQSDDTGYAQFANYNIQGSQIASPSIYNGSHSIFECEIQCDAVESCDAVYYDGGGHDGLCYLKTDSVLQGTLVADPAGTTTPDVIAIEGTCAELSQYYPAQAMSSCCDNPSPGQTYPVCTAPYSTGTKSGYAVFANYDFQNDDVTYGNYNEDIANCVTFCQDYGPNNADGDETVGCLGFTRRGSYCYSKAIDLSAGAFHYYNETGLQTYLAGGCSALSALAPADALAACCDDL